jgi:processive 1,2-diacylglycerol beta-glucosyltransferase
MRILIATVTAGGGHLAAANALREAWLEQRPGDSVECWDLLDFFSPLHRRLYIRGYVRLVEHAPEIWGAVFKKTDEPAVARRLTRIRRLFPSPSQRRFEQKLRTFKPAALLCTHYLPLETAARLDAAEKPFVASIVTDFEAHALWMSSAVDLYCVASEPTRVRLLARGVNDSAVTPTGIPISPRFRALADPGLIRKTMGLRDDLPVVLVLGGGFGLGPVARILAELDKASGEFQVVVVTGRNIDLRRELAAQDRAHPTRVLGFAGNMHELMAISALIITKPGGLTTSEALAVGRPLVIVDPIPGQEAANSDFLLEQGAAIKINRVEDLSYRMKDLLSGPRLEGLSRAACHLGKPNAAQDVCRQVLRRMPGQ